MCKHHYQHNMRKFYLFFEMQQIIKIKTEEMQKTGLIERVKKN
jgi:hypothetical protein